jgi:hypothetical protein
MTLQLKFLQKKDLWLFCQFQIKKLLSCIPVHNSNNREEENIQELIKDKNFRYKIRAVGKN